MKVLVSFVFLFVFGLSISAQSPTDLFADGAKQVNAGQFDEALRSYTMALAAAETRYADKNYRARLQYNIGVCYFHLDRFDLAVNHFKQAVLLKTDYALAYHALGVTKIRAQKLKGAASQLRAGFDK